MKSYEHTHQHRYPFYCLFSYPYVIYTKTAQIGVFFTLWCRTCADVFPSAQTSILSIILNALREKNFDTGNSTRYSFFALWCCYISLGYNTSAQVPDTSPTFEGISNAGKSSLRVGFV
jgi:hypothetical protein